MRIGVVGGGTMGAGIIALFAGYGYEVVFTELNEELVERAKKNCKLMLRLLQRELKKDREWLKESWERITGSTSYEVFKGSDFVIEAVVESEKVKAEVYRRVREVVGENAVLATNTSSLPISSLAAHDPYPHNFLGTHFFNPPVSMKLVELVKGEKTSEEAVKRSLELLKSVEREPVEAPDTPGFIVNRILIPMINEAVRLYEAGVKPEDIDKAMVLGTGVPVGPLKLADMVGLDVLYAVCNVLHSHFGDYRFKPPEALERLVKEGALGKKSGKGFYNYHKR
jgi:3-hydroxybutyryl-CoA dehydrogenase